MWHVLHVSFCRDMWPTGLLGKGSIWIKLHSPEQEKENIWGKEDLGLLLLLQTMISIILSCTQLVILTLCQASLSCESSPDCRQAGRATGCGSCLEINKGTNDETCEIWYSISAFYDSLKHVSASLLSFLLTPSVKEEEDDDDPHGEDETHKDEVPSVPEVPGGHCHLGHHRQVCGEHHGGAQHLGHLTPLPVIYKYSKRLL